MNKTSPEVKRQRNDMISESEFFDDSINTNKNEGENEEIPRGVFRLRSSTKSPPIINENKVSAINVPEKYKLVSVRIPRIDEKTLSSLFTKKIKPEELQKVNSSKEITNAPIFKIQFKEQGSLKRTRRTGRLTFRKRRHKKTISSNQQVLAVEEPLPDIEGAQIVDVEQNKPKDCSQDSSSIQKNSSSKEDLPEIGEVSEILDIKVDGKSCEKLKLKLNRELSENKNINCRDGNWKSVNTFQTGTDKNISENNEVECQALFKKLIERFLENPQIEELKNSAFLKKGLCCIWLDNNFHCSNQHCMYNHNASNLFSRKLKCHSSKFVLLAVASLKNDQFFVDATLSALKILSQRKSALLWVTFLVYFVFYVTEPTDRTLLKFWANAARFFCSTNEGYGGANGFASLLCIFSKGEKSDEWKIFEFIKVIQKPPIQLRVTYALLRPILHLKLSTELLTAAVESATVTQVDVMKVYRDVVPKILLKNFPIDSVEVLLKFCSTLDKLNENKLAKNLLQILAPKVKKYKIKLVKEDFPHTAAFQEELLKNPTATYETEPSFEDFGKDLDGKLHVNKGNDYFDVEKKFVNKMIVAFNSESCETQFLPKTFRVLQISGEQQVQKAVSLFNEQQFELFGKYLNELKEDAQQPAAEQILNFLFKMKISLEQLVDLLKLFIYFCKSKPSAKVLASISLTIVLNLVKIGEWDKAYVLASACIDKQIDIVEDTVFVSQEFISFTKLKTVLIILELYIFKKNFKTALELVKKYWLYSPKRFLWKLNWKDNDEIIRVRILEEFLMELILDHSTEMAYELFSLISREQKETHRPIDLNKFVNEVLSLLLNMNNEEAVLLYENLSIKFQLNDNVVRTLLVAFVRQNRVSQAKHLLLSYNQSIYILPKVTFGVLNVKVCSNWLEEEIFVFFDCLLDLLITKKRNKGALGFLNYGGYQILINISDEEITVPSKIKPLCLSLLDSSVESAFIRIQKVLENQFTPSLSITYKFDSLMLDNDCLKLYINSRICPAL